MPENDKIVNLEFPEGGVDKLREFQEQEPGTTPQAENVRALNADTLRTRGGSRSGLIKYVPDRIPADVTQSLVIQHLNIIVDPQAEALQQTFVVPGDDWVEDPQNPGFFVPPGGWGFQPNPNAPPPVPPIPPGGFFVQRTGTNGGIGETASEFTCSLSSPATNGNVVLIWVSTSQLSQGDVDGDLAVSVSVENSSGGSFTQCGTTVVAQGETGANPGVVTYRRMSLWRRVVATAADSDVVVTPNPDTVADTNISTISVFVTMLEYTGLDTGTPFQSFSKNSINGIPASSIDTGSAAGDSADLVVSAIISGTGNTPSPSLNDRTYLVPVYDSVATGSADIVYTLDEPVQAVTAVVAVFNKAP